MDALEGLALGIGMFSEEQLCWGEKPDACSQSWKGVISIDF